MLELLISLKNTHTPKRAVNYPGIVDNSTAENFLIDVLRNHPDYNQVALTLLAQ